MSKQIYGPSIVIPVELQDINTAIKELQGDLKSLKGFGLDKIMSDEIKNVEHQLSNFEKKIDDFTKKKLDVSSNVKGDNELIHRVELLESQTSSLKESMMSLISVFAKADDGQFSKVLENMAKSMNQLQNTTTQTVEKLNKIQNNTNIKTEVDNLEKEAKRIQHIKEKLNISNIVDLNETVDVSNFEEAERQFLNLAKIIENLYDELQSLNDKPIKGNFSDGVKVLDELSKRAQEFTNLMLSLSSDYPDKWEKISNGTTDNAEIICSNVESIINESYKNIDRYLDYVDNVIVGKKKQIGVSSDNVSSKDDKTIRSTMEISTKPTTVLSDAKKIIRYVNENLNDTPIEAQVSLTTAWGTRKLNDLLKKFQQQINNLSDESVKSEYQDIINRISSSFGNQISLNFSSNFSKVNDEATEGIAKIRKSLEKSMALNIQPYVDKADKQTLQESLNNLSKDLVLTINDIQINDEAVKEAQKKTGQDKIKRRTVDAEQLAKTLSEISSVLKDIAESTNTSAGNFEHITISIEALTDALRKMSNISGESGISELDQMFTSLQERVSKITKLNAKGVAQELRDIVKEFQNYKDLGGENFLVDLGGSLKVQERLEKEYDKIQESGVETGEHYAEGIESTKPLVEKAGVDIAEIVADAVRKTSDVNSPSKVAESLGQYWGEGYAEGILNSSDKVRNAIRALYEAGKIELQDLAKDSVHAQESDDIYNAITGGAPRTYKINDKINIINQIDAYQKLIRDAGHTKISSGFDSDKRKNILSIQIQNLKDLRNGAISAEEAFDELHKAFMATSRERTKLSAKAPNKPATANEEVEHTIAELEEQKQGVDKLKASIEELTASQKENADDEYWQSLIDQASIEEANEAIREESETIATASDNAAELVANVEKYVKLAAELKGKDFVARNPFDSKFKPTYDKLFNISNNAEDKNQNVANNVLEMLSAYGRTGNTDILKTVQGYINQSDLNKNIKKFSNLAIDKVFREAEKEVVKTADTIVPVETKKSVKEYRALSKKDFKDYFKSQYKGDQEAFEHNFQLALEKLQKEGLAEQKVYKGGKKGAWSIKVDADEYNKYLGVIQQTDTIDRQHAETLKKKDQIIQDVQQSVLELTDEEAKLAQSGDSWTDTGLTEEQRRNELAIAEKLIDTQKEINQLKQEEFNISEEEARAAQSGDLWTNRGLSDSELKEELQTAKEFVEVQEELNSKTNNNDGFGKVAKGASNAAKNKTEFANANKEVLKSIVESINGLNNEGKAFENITKLINALGGKNGDQKLRATVEGLIAITDALSTPLQENSLIEALERIAASGSNLADIATVLKASKKSIETAKKVINTNETDKEEVENINNLNRAINNLKKSSKEYYQLLEKSVNNDLREEEADKLNRIESEYDELIAKVQQYISVLGDSEGLSKKLADAQKDALQEYNNLQEKYLDSASSIINNARENPEHQNKNYTSSFVKELEEASEAVKNYQELIRQHGNDRNLWDREAIRQAQEYKNTIDSTITSIKDKNNVVAKSITIDKLLAHINRDLNDNTAMPQQLRSQYLALRDSIDEIRQSTKGLNEVDLNQLTGEFQHLHEQLLRTGQTGKSVVQQIAEAAKSQTVQFVARYFSLQDWIRYGREAFNTIKDLDYQLVDLRKTTTMNNSDLEEFYLNANKIAKQLGTTTSQIIQQAAAWSRLGYNTKETSEAMAEMSSQFAAISPGMSLDDATDGLVSTMKAFHIDVKDTERDIMDNVNRIGKQQLPKHMVTYGAAKAA